MVKGETFPDREQAEHKMLEWPDNAGINLTGYVFTDQNLVIL